MKEIFRNFIKVISPFVFGVFMTALSLAILQPYMATKHEVYRDMILEHIALDGANKSGELVAVWISLFIGAFSIFIFKHFADNNSKFVLKEKENIKLDFIGIGIILIPSLFILFFKQEINFYLVFAGVIYYISYFITDKNTLISKKILLLLVSLYLFSMSLKAVTDKIFKNMELIKTDMVFMLTVVLFIYVIFVLSKKNFSGIDEKILLFQIPAPLSLLSFLTDKYLLNGEIYKINQLSSYRIIIILLIVFLLVLNAIQYKKRKSNGLILFSSVIIIFILHYHSFPMNIHYGDFWHTGEETVPWHQIVNKKMKLFVEYNGTSGFYGLVPGFFQNVILDKTVLSFYPAMSLTYISWSLIIGFACYCLVGEYAMVLAFFIDIPKYDRPIPLLLALLILLFPKLIRKKIKWLQIYAIFSIYIFFYYPLNGAAFALGLFPFAITQIYYIFRKKMWKKEIKSVSFWILNVILIGSFVYLFNLIVGMIKNILLLSSQTKLADGIAVYNHSIYSPWFLKFLKSDNLKKYAWYIFIYLVIISVVLFFWYTVYCYFQKYKKEKLFSKLDSPIFLILTSASIILPINYTFTLVRMDYKGEYARTTSIMAIFIGFLLNILLYRYGKRLFSKNLRIIFIGLILGFVYLIQGNVIGYEVKKIQKMYVIPEGFTYIDGTDIGIPKLGRGFLKMDTLNSLKIIKENVGKMVISGERFWPSGKRELLYIFDTKIAVKIDSMKLTKSLKSSVENIKMLEKNPPVFITDVLDYESYYTYRWILDHGYVMYVDRGETFWIRPDAYERVFGNTTEAQRNMLDTYPSQDIKKIPYSMGNSMKTLENIFSDRKKVNINDLKSSEYSQMEKVKENEFKISDKWDPFFVINLPESIPGKNFDFIYMELNSNFPIKDIKNLKIQMFWDSKEFSLSENRTVRFDYGNGKLLIPVGSHPAWLSSNITRLRIDIEDGKPGMEFEIKKLEFLKLDLNRKI